MQKTIKKISIVLAITIGFQMISHAMDMNGKEHYEGAHYWIQKNQGENNLLNVQPIENGSKPKSPVPKHRLRISDICTITNGRYEGRKVEIMKSFKDRYGIESIKDVEENTELLIKPSLFTYLYDCRKDDTYATISAITMALSHNKIPVASYIKEQYLSGHCYFVRCVETLEFMCVHETWLCK